MLGIRINIHLLVVTVTLFRKFVYIIYSSYNSIDYRKKSFIGENMSLNDIYVNITKCYGYVVKSSLKKSTFFQRGGNVQEIFSRYNI